MWEPECRDYCITEWSFHHCAAVIPSAEVKSHRSDAELRQCVAKSQSVQNARSIWADLNSGADLTQRVSLFVDMNIEPGAQQ